MGANSLFTPSYKHPEEIFLDHASNEFVEATRSNRKTCLFFEDPLVPNWEDLNDDLKDDSTSDKKRKEQDDTKSI